MTDVAKVGPSLAPADLPLLAHLDRLMEELHAQVPKALQDWDEEGIHRARVATRRLSAALRLVKMVVAKKRRKALSRVLRKLRRRLGPLRDADVMLGHLQEISDGAAKHGAAVEWLVGRLVEEREALRQESAKRVGAAQVLADLGAWHPVREQIAEARDALPKLLAESLHLQLDAFVEHAGRIVQGAADAAHHDPHELRIAGKALRYTLEMAVAQGSELPASVMKTFKRMQELLGAWHDFVVLADKAMAVSLHHLLSHRDPALQEEVFDLARTTLRRSARELGQFAKVWSAKGQQLAGVIRAAFPLSPAPAGRLVSESQTDRGRLDSGAEAASAASPPDAPSAAS